MAVTSICVTHRVCLRDQTESAPALYLACPHTRGVVDAECYVLIRRGDGVYGVCTDHVSRWPAHEHAPRLARLRAEKPELAALLESPDRAAPWPVPQITVEMFERLAARGELGLSSPSEAVVRYVCVPEEAAGRRLPHLVEVGYIYGIQDPVDEHEPMPASGYWHRCPGCGRTHHFVGSFDGHAVRVYCRCGTERELWQWLDLHDAAIKGLREDGFTWFLNRCAYRRVTTSVAQMRERGMREGWYPESVTAHDEAVLAEAMATAGPTTVRGEQAARELAHQWLHAMSVADTISDALTRDDQLNRQLRALTRR